jgi:hypothetical protein
MASPAKHITMTWIAWWKMFRQLSRRGRSKRESGAFLLGVDCDETAIVKECVYYDDIDPTALDKGYVHLSGAALTKVWDRCAETGFQVLADVHTHPLGAGQSESDQAYPMIAIPGHTALIIPNFARSATFLRGIGVYRHLGAKRWVTLPSPRLGWLSINIT